MVNHLRRARRSGTIHRTALNCFSYSACPSSWMCVLVVRYWIAHTVWGRGAHEGRSRGSLGSRPGRVNHTHSIQPRCDRAPSWPDMAYSRVRVCQSMDAHGMGVHIFADRPHTFLPDKVHIVHWRNRWDCTVYGIHRRRPNGNTRQDCMMQNKGLRSHNCALDQVVPVDWRTLHRHRRLCPGRHPDRRSQVPARRYHMVP